MKILVKLLILVNLFSCGMPRPEPGQSQTTGTGLLFFPRPKHLSEEKIPAFAQHIQNATRGASIPSAAMGEAGASAAAASTARSYLGAVAKFGGVPREQGAAILKKVVSDQSGTCGGASCSRALGIHVDQVDAFLDNLYYHVASSPTAAQRPVLLASLASEAALTKPVLPKDIVANIFEAKPILLPSFSKSPAGLLSHPEFMMKGGTSVGEAIHRYSTSGFHDARRAETSTIAEAAKAGVSAMRYMLWRDRVRLINERLAVLPVVKQPVYRGINKVSYETVASWINKWQNKQPIHLGPDDKPAITSATWDISVAKKFLRLNIAGLLGRNDNLSVLFEIHGHHGVGIENVSHFPREREVLLPAWQGYMIEEIVPVGYFRRAIRIKIRGIPVPEPLDKAALTRYMEAPSSAASAPKNAPPLSSAASGPLVQGSKL